MARQSTVAAPIEVHRLEEGLSHHSFTIEPQALDISWPDLRLTQAIELSVDVVRMGEDLQVNARLTTAAAGTCDRCLSSVGVPVA